MNTFYNIGNTFYQNSSACNPKSQVSFGQRQNLNKIWDYTDKLLLNKINQNKNAPFSKNPQLNFIEKLLSASQINVRFKENLKLGIFIKDKLDKMQKFNLELPKNILFFPSILFDLTAIKGLTYNFFNNCKQSVIILPKNIYKKKDGEQTFFHEAGHWLHFQENYDVEKNCEIWHQNANLERIKEVVSKSATKVNDGSELCAEIFSRQMLGEDLPEDIIELAEKLSCPIIKK